MSKRRLFLMFTVGFAALLFGLPALTAFALPGVVTSGFQVMNIDSMRTDVSVRYVPAGGGAEQTQGLISIEPGQSHNFFGDTMDVSTGFNGSLVIESYPAEVAAIANLLTTGPNMAGSYNGVSIPGKQLYAPLIMRKNGGYSTEIHLQNAGDAATTATIEFMKSGSTTPQVTITRLVQAGARVTIDQGSSDPQMVALGDKWVGSAEISSPDQNLAALVTETNSQDLLVYSAFASGASTIYGPLVQNNNSGWNSGIQIQHIGGTSGTVDLYVNGVKIGSRSMAPGQSWTVYPVSFNGKVGAAKVVGPSGSSLVGIVNQLGPGNQGMAYGMFASGTQRVVAPLLMRENNGWSTGFQVQNVGSSSTTVQLKLNGTAVTSPEPLAAGASKTYFPLPGGTGKFVGAGEVVGGAGAQLVGIVNEICTTSACVVGDNGMAYEAVNVAP